jgi:hypothetical protein
MDSCQGIEQKNSLQVRGFEAEFLVHQIIARLKQAALNRRTSVEQLSRMLNIGGETLIEHGDLIFASRCLQRFSGRAFYSSDTHFRPILERIHTVVEHQMQTLDIRHAVSTMFELYFMVDEIKEKYQTVKAKMIQDIQEHNGILEALLEDVYKNGSHHLTRRDIISILEKNDTPLAVRLRQDQFMVDTLAVLISAAENKEQARELIQVNYMAQLVMPAKDSLEFTHLEMRAMHETLKENQGGFFEKPPPWNPLKNFY